MAFLGLSFPFHGCMQVAVCPPPAREADPCDDKPRRDSLHPTQVLLPQVVAAAARPASTPPAAPACIRPLPPSALGHSRRVLPPRPRLAATAPTVAMFRRRLPQPPAAGSFGWPPPSLLVPSSRRRHPATTIGR